MRNYKVCTRCVMDTTDSDIIFDKRGVCNYCYLHDRLEKINPKGKIGQQKINKIVEEIKKKGKNKKYDCIIGVSGGTDSSYILYLAKKAGLKPLAVHLDNGWNTKIGEQNVRKITSKLGIKLYTYVLDWEEFKNLQIAFLKASTPDIEVPTDLAIRAIVYKVAAKHDIKYILNGMNFRTEGKVPLKWSYGDNKYLKFINKEFGKGNFGNFPKYSLLHIFYYHFVKKIKQIRPLNFIDYDKEIVKKILQKELGWEDYGGHHYESIYTRFTQGYYLPKKFGFDKRKVEYSAFVRTGKMCRNEALKKLENEPPCPKEITQEDIKSIKSKLEISDQEFSKIMYSPPKLFLDYPNNFLKLKKYRKLLIFLIKFIYPTTPKFLLMLEYQNLMKVK